MLKFEVESAVSVRSGRSREGKSFEMREQVAYVTMGREVRKVLLRVEDGKQPLAAGFYTIGDDSFTTDKYGNLSIARLSLIPSKG